MPRLSMSPLARFCFYPVRKASKICCETVLFRCETRVVVYRRASLRNKQGCPACFIERQRGVSIRMPLLHQSVCRPFLPKAAVQN